MDFNGIQTERFERLGRKLLSIKNAGVIATLAPELQIGVDVPVRPTDWAYLGESHFSWGYFVAAVAAQYSRFGIRNNGADAVVVVTGFTLAGTAAMGQYFLSQSIAAGLGGLAVQLCSPSDTRQRGTLADVIVEAGAAVNAPPFWGTASVVHWGYDATATEHTVTLPEPLVLGPAGKLLLECNQINLGIFGGFTGYTRKLDPGELVP